MVGREVRREPRDEDEAGSCSAPNNDLSESVAV